MTLSRRQLSKLGLIGLSALTPLAWATRTVEPASDKLKLLVLGGTGFLGPHLVEYALKRGHTVTLFNRGRTAGRTFPGLETIKGNRAKNLSGLKGRSWDVVIDTSAFAPNWVTKSAKLLKPNVGHYIFVSTVSVYRPMTEPHLDESAPIYSLDAPDADKFSNFERYGANKAACEQRVRDVFPEHNTQVRSDTISGPGDHQHHRMLYWVKRGLLGGEILAPGEPGDYIQYVDARDLGEWTVHCAEKGITGTYNASSPPDTVTMSSLIGACQQAAAVESMQTWVPTEFLIEKGVLDIPFWMPRRAEFKGTGRMSTSAAQAQGLKHRPTLETVTDALAWYRNLPPEKQQLSVIFNADQEAQILRAWSESSSQD